MRKLRLSVQYLLLFYIFASFFLLLGWVNGYVPLWVIANTIVMLKATQILKKWGTIL